MRFPHLLVAILVVATPLMASRSAQAQCEYAIELIGLEGCGFNAYSISPRAISNNGVVVGHYTGCGSLAFRAFRWSSSEGFQHLSLGPGIVDGRASAVSPNGQYIVGRVQRAGDLLYRAFIWKDGQYTFIEPLDPTLETLAYAVLDDGTVFGDYFDMFAGAQVFAWRDGKYLPLPAGLDLKGQDSRPLAARYPYVVGWVRNADTLGYLRDGFIWDLRTDTVELLPKLPDLGYSCKPNAVNARGQAAGQCRQGFPDVPPPADISRPVTWYGGSITDVGTPPYHDSGQLWGINEAGHLVGQTTCDNGGAACPSDRAGLWINGVRRSLNSLLPPRWPGSTNEVWAIADDGSFVAQGVHQARNKGYVFSPVGVVDADITIDCKVDVADLKMVLEFWGLTEESPVKRADIDGDGEIGPRDLAEILGAWSP